MNYVIPIVLRSSELERVWARPLYFCSDLCTRGHSRVQTREILFFPQNDKKLNCHVFVVMFQLTLRRIMDTAKQVTKSGNLDEFSMVLLNNTLSLPLGLLLVLLFNEVDYLSTTWGSTISLHYPLRLFLFDFTL